MTIVPVSLGERSYEVRIEAGLLDRAGDALAPYKTNRPFLVVTDANVAAAQWHRLEAALRSAGLQAELVTLPAGESTKSWAHLEALTDRMIEHGIERRDHVIALGGGVIGDLVGFAAAIVKRGCNFIQIPTTLLAQVDSSVGGKTAINSRAGKNLLGAFHQPALVLIDPDTLDTLGAREVGAGYAEVVKYGLIDDPAFFEWCEANGRALLDGDSEARAYAIARSVAAKAAIVDRLLHGEGVAAGMALAFGYSVRRGECSGQDAGRVVAHLRAVGLPASLADAGIEASGARLVEHMLHDKKMSAGTLPFLLARGIGQTYLAKDVDLADVAAFLDGR